MTDNPYQTPQYTPTAGPSPRDRLRIPAILLLVCEVPWAGWILLTTLLQIGTVVANVQGGRGAEASATFWASPS